MGIVEIVLITFILEVIESYIQYGRTLKEVVEKLYRIYQKSPFLFFIIHLDYLWLLFISLAYSNLSWPLIFAIALKTFDIFTKLDLIKRVYIKEDREMEEFLNLQMPPWTYLVSIFTYPYLVYLAFAH